MDNFIEISNDSYLFIISKTESEILQAGGSFKKNGMFEKISFFYFKHFALIIDTT